MKTLRLLIVAVCIVVTLAPSAFAWNAVGHYLVAKVAYAHLSPEERQKVIDVLKEHPHYKTYLSADRPAGVDEQEWVFMRAATWSDWIRPPRKIEGDIADHSIHKFHRSTWHYVNYPLKKGQTDLKLGQPLPQEFNVQQQIPRSIEFAKAMAGADPDQAKEVTPAQNRAVRLCWVFHLVGDIHQPCHVTAWVDPVRLPGGDQGGNLTTVKVDIGAEPTKLHTFWDALLGTDADAETVDETAHTLRNDSRLADDKLAEAKNGDVAAWVQESFELAAKYAYLSDELPIVQWDDYKSGAVGFMDVPILPLGAERRARAVARRQVVVAGIRLADKLRETIQ
jgi:hypothetical protein